MIISNHALQRWMQRFPRMNIKQKLAEATLTLSTAEMYWLKIRSRSSDHQNNRTSRGGWATYRKTPDGIIFVFSQGGVVVTVFRANRAAVHRIKKRICAND